ncbi:MAG: hypothetical protein Kow0042_16030 [Calditrichia bacterium]
MDVNKIREVKKRYEKQWLAIPEVVGVGIGTTSKKGIGIIISVKQNPESVRQQIPSEIEGVPVEIRETGELKAL